MAEVALTAIAQGAVLPLVQGVAEDGALALLARHVSLGELVLAGTVRARLARATQAMLLLVLLLAEWLALLHARVVAVWERLAGLLAAFAEIAR